MRLLHLSSAVLKTVTSLINNGAPVIPEQIWSTYPCEEKLYDGVPISCDEETKGLIKYGLLNTHNRDSVVVMVPRILPGNVGWPLTLTPGFTVVEDGRGMLYSFQCVLIAAKLLPPDSEIASTSRAKFHVVPLFEVTAWNLDNRGREVRAVTH